MSEWLSPSCSQAYCCNQITLSKDFRFLRPSLTKEVAKRFENSWAMVLIPVLSLKGRWKEETGEREMAPSEF